MFDPATGATDDGNSQTDYLNMVAPQVLPYPISDARSDYASLPVVSSAHVANHAGCFPYALHNQPLPQPMPSLFPSRASSSTFDLHAQAYSHITSDVALAPAEQGQSSIQQQLPASDLFPASAPPIALAPPDQLGARMSDPYVAQGIIPDANLAPSVSTHVDPQLVSTPFTDFYNLIVAPMMCSNAETYLPSNAPVPSDSTYTTSSPTNIIPSTAHSFTALLSPMPPSTGAIPSPAPSYPCLTNGIKQKRPPPPLVLDQSTLPPFLPTSEYSYGPITPITPMPLGDYERYRASKPYPLAPVYTDTSNLTAMGTYCAPPPPAVNVSTPVHDSDDPLVASSSFGITPHTSASPNLAYTGQHSFLPYQPHEAMTWVYVDSSGRTYSCGSTVPPTPHTYEPHFTAHDSRPSTAGHVYPSSASSGIPQHEQQTSYEIRSSTAGQAYPPSATPTQHAPQRQSVDSMNPRLQAQLYELNKLKRASRKALKKSARAVTITMPAQVTVNQEQSMPGPCLESPSSSGAGCAEPSQVQVMQVQDEQIDQAGLALKHNPHRRKKARPHHVQHAEALDTFDPNRVINYTDVPHDGAVWVACRDNLLRKIEWTSSAGRKGDHIFRQCADCKLRTTKSFRISMQDPDQVVCTQCGIWQEYNGTSRPIFRYRRYRVNENDPKSRFKVSLEQSIATPLDQAYNGRKKRAAPALELPPKRLRTLDAAW